MKTPDEIATALLGSPYESLDAHRQRVAHHIAQRTPIARNVSEDFAGSTFGQRAADAVARFGGSWPFITIFLVLMVTWIALNAFFLVRRDEVFDPYPFILLNLFLSMLAAIQAPIILMSQNRQGQKDRIDAGHDYEVNLKSELEIMVLHEKMDILREAQWRELLALQAQQLQRLDALIARTPGAGGTVTS